MLTFLTTNVSPDAFSGFQETDVVELTSTRSGVPVPRSHGDFEPRHVEAAMGNVPK